MPSFLLFSRVVKDKLPAVPGTVDHSRHDDTVKRNRVPKEKWKLIPMRNEEQKQLS